MPVPGPGPVPPPGFGPGFDLQPIVTLFFIIVGLGIVFSIGKAVLTTLNNASEPLLHRPARLTAKRQTTSVSGGMNDTPASSTTWHYVTFEFADGSREEFGVKGQEYGLLAEGDTGMLHSQGTWFKGFDRDGAPREVGVR